MQRACPDITQVLLYRFPTGKLNILTETEVSSEFIDGVVQFITVGLFLLLKGMSNPQMSAPSPSPCISHVVSSF